VVIASVTTGLVSTAAVVVQAVALAALLAGAMPGARPGDRVRELSWLAAGAGVRGLCALVVEVLARVGASSAKADLRRRLVVASLREAPGGSGTPGDVAALAGRGLDALDVYIGRCIPDLVLAVAAPIALAIAIGALDWLSAVVIVVAIGLFPVFGALVGRASATLAGERWRQVESLGRTVADVFEGLSVLRAFGRSAQQRARIEQVGEALRRASVATLRTAFLSALVLDTLASVSVALVAVPLGLRLLDGSVHLAAALAVLIIAPEVFLPLRRASAEFHESTEGLAAAAHALALVGSGDAGDGDGDGEGEGEGEDDRPGADPARAPAPDPALVPVTLRAVRVEVGGRAEPVLDDAWLTVEPGETVVVMGPNGAGKTTVLSVLLGFVRPTGGTVTVGGTDLGRLDMAAWRRRVTYLPEHPSLLGASLADNLRLARPEAGDDELLAALAAAGASEFLAELPGGLDTVLGDGRRPISAGELQRIALARTLLRPASLYLLDEPTVHLDAPTEAIVVDGLRRVLASRSAVVVTHRPAVAALADRVVTLAGGRFVAPAAPFAPAADVTPAGLVGLVGGDKVPA
jgi:thiol reductant ABC exporter CydD subunit